MGYPQQESIAKGSWLPGLAANSAGDAGFPVATITEPATTTTSLIIPCQNSATDLMFYGTDAADEAGTIFLALWDVLHNDNATTTDLWVPEHVATLAVTLGAKVGVAATEMLNTDFIADTIVVTRGDSLLAAPARLAVHSPANDENARVRVRTDGRKYLGVYFTTGTAATLNCIWRNR